MMKNSIKNILRVIQSLGDGRKGSARALTGPPNPNPGCACMALAPAGNSPPSTVANEGYLSEMTIACIMISLEAFSFLQPSGHS